MRSNQPWSAEPEIRSGFLPTRAVAGSAGNNPGRHPRNGRTLLAVAVLLGAFLAHLLRAVDLPPFPSPEAPLAQIAQLQRFLALATTPSPHEPPLRVLFYGQSIIDQWWSRLADELRRRYPLRPWVFENRSLGGHTAPFLLKTAEADVYAFQPDLLVFHEYDESNGPWESYAAFLERVRQRTCADILMVGNHLASYDALDEDSRTNGLPISQWPGLCAVDTVYLPAIARCVGACWADIRTPWKRYLLEHSLDPALLRTDLVHLNDAGISLVIRLLGSYLESRRFVPPIDPYDCGRVTRLPIQGRGAIEFVGNRILLAARPATSSTIRCRVDGKRPSEFRELYRHGRTSAWPGLCTPALLKVGAVAVPKVEDWILVVDEVLGPRAVAFHVIGSVTGADGTGRSDEDFTSHSGRVQVLSADWYWRAPLFGGQVSPGFAVRWTTRFYGSDEVTTGAIWNWVEVANGLADGPHTLELELLQGTRDSFPELLVYHPAGSEVGGVPDSVVRYLRRDDRLLIRWPALEGSAGATSSDFSAWDSVADPDLQFGRGQVEISTDDARRFYMLRASPAR